MQPYEIRQLSDGSIDYNNFIARPISLLTPNMRRFSRQAMSAKLWLIMGATIAALALIPILLAETASRGQAADFAKLGRQSTSTSAAPR